MTTNKKTKAKQNNSEELETVRRAILNALDECSFDGHGWEDSDLPALFRVIDPIAKRINAKARKASQ